MIPVLDHRVAGLLTTLYDNVARGNKPPNDIDIWVDCSTDTKYRKIKQQVRDSGLRFDSVFPMHWIFSSNDYGPMAVELLGFTNVPATFTKVKKRAVAKDIGGVNLMVAPPEFVGVSTKVENSRE